MYSTDAYLFSFFLLMTLILQTCLVANCTVSNCWGAVEEFMFQADGQDCWSMFGRISLACLLEPRHSRIHLPLTEGHTIQPVRSCAYVNGALGHTESSLF